MAWFIELTKREGQLTRVNAENILYYYPNTPGEETNTIVEFGTVSLKVRETYEDLGKKLR